MSQKNQETDVRRGIVDELFAPARRNFARTQQIVKGPNDQVDIYCMYF
jgi:hypothetical protein